MQYTEEQIIRANQTDLVSFLSAQGEQLGKSGKEYRWKKHDSVTVSGNRWYRHSQGRGGYPVDFVMEFYNATFPEAVKMLTGEEGEGRNSTCPAPSPDFRLPEKEENNDRIIRYLTENRGIEKNLVEKWISSGDIYEEKKHHNVVFVGRDADGIPRYAHCRGTGETKYRGDVAESDKSYGFCHRGTDNQLFVFEAAIDLLSFIQLFPKDWKKRSYLSLGGISSAALMAFLSERPQITSVFLCLDNDHAGNEASEKLAIEIPDGYSVIRLKPSRKDWNEILCDKNADRKNHITVQIKGSNYMYFEKRTDRNRKYRKFLHSHQQNLILLGVFVFVISIVCGCSNQKEQESDGRQGHGKSNFFRNMTDKGFLLKQYNGEFYYQDIAVKEEDFCPVDPEERIPFEETDTDYKQLQLNMNQGIKGI